MHLAFLGLGQIGGSVARAALGSGFTSRVTAWTPSGAGPRAAAADGIAAASSAGEAIRGADLVILAAPPLACLDLLDDLAGPLSDARAAGAVVTDVASTKGAIVAKAAALGLPFVGGHPMAGRESAGYGAADPELVRGRPWIVVAGQDTDAAAVQLVEDLARACGANPVRLGAAEHDAAVALISHAPLVVSAALAEVAAARGDWPVAASIAAGGWAGMTRLARGEPEMGAGILATNGPLTAAVLRAIAAAVSDWAGLLERDPEPSELEGRLAAARAAAGGDR